MLLLNFIMHKEYWAKWKEGGDKWFANATSFLALEYSYENFVLFQNIGVLKNQGFEIPFNGFTVLMVKIKIKWLPIV